MTDLSPAAQAVLDAYGNELLRPGPLIMGRHPLAAALRAAADQVVPAPPCIDSCCEVQQSLIHLALLTIAAELEGAR